MIKRFEYLFKEIEISVFLSIMEYEDEIKELGLIGWELCTINHVSGIMVFKRELLQHNTGEDNE